MSQSIEEKLQLLDALKERFRLEMTTSFKAFVKEMAPIILPEGRKMKWGKHLDIICEKIEAVERGDIRRLMVFLPPGSMKSVLANVLGTAWCLGRNPSWQILSISHSTLLSHGFGLKIRDLIRMEEYARIFPGMSLREDSQAAGLWRTEQKGVFVAAGAGTHIAGVRGNLAILDDVISEQTAYSKVEREKIIRWWPGGFKSRVLPDSRIIVINTRWAQMDLAGWLLHQQDNNKYADKWEVVSFPALLDEPASKMLGYEPGTSYWPEMWPTEMLKATRDGGMPASQWDALYMQKPTPEDGSVFKEKYFRKWPLDEPPECSYIIQTIDAAATAQTYSDYSVIQTWGIWGRVSTDKITGQEVTTYNLILLSNWQDKVEYPDLRRHAQRLYEEWKPNVVVAEKKSAGISLIQDLRVAGVPIHEYLPDKDKVARAYAASPLMEAGRVWVPAGKEFARKLMDEALSFSPSGAHAHDDQVDAMVMAVLYLKESWALTHPADPWDDMPQSTRRQGANSWRR